MIDFYMEKDIKDVQSYAEVSNNHIDEIVESNNVGLFWKTIDINYKNKIRSFGIYDQKKKQVAIIYDDDYKNAPSEEPLILYAERQWKRLNEARK
jgi:hypothetical protein